MGANTKTDTRKRRDRGSISADEILKGAFDVAAQVSIDKLSMPVLAKHLDVGVTSIYWYFRRKDDLLDAMTDLALGVSRFAITRTRCARTFVKSRYCAIWFSFEVSSAAAQCAEHCRRSSNQSRR